MTFFLCLFDKIQEMNKDKWEPDLLNFNEYLLNIDSLVCFFSSLTAWYQYQYQCYSSLVLRTA